MDTGGKVAGDEPEYSPPSSAEVKKTWSYTSTPPIRLRGAVLGEAQGQLFTFTFTLYPKP